MATDRTLGFNQPQSMSDDAKKQLDDLADWFKTANVEKVRTHLSHYTGKDSLDKMQPLLKELGLYEKGSGSILCRLSGRETIAKDRGFDNIFIPLSHEFSIGNHTLRPGQYIRSECSQVLDTFTDFVLVLVPEKSQK
ncbi:predicted protein [Uncinocarpus reesii 1704]|uniref:Uncharacterized protein n=1 Tax=Uncinocarpus reesii (strain UAMH 1704) TaxID=336963 RepID=C4K097_UNCRE|nr:uncharacterized protein UREG_07911 [Uncinocarpus reesii 1704]EEP83046.1 predicted protein [Uncinocarpus reesii 1704]